MSRCQARRESIAGLFEPTGLTAMPRAVNLGQQAVSALSQVV
jgi:hypothetical protein